MTEPNLKNYWCPACRRWVAGDDMYLDKAHKDCGTKCEWRRYVCGEKVTKYEAEREDVIG